MTRPRRPSRIWVLWCSSCGWIDDRCARRFMLRPEAHRAYHVDRGQTVRVAVVRYDRAKGAR